MTTTPIRRGTDLAEHGLSPTGFVERKPTVSQLYVDAVRRGDGQIVEGGPLAVDTGKHTGRSPNDKFIVREAGSEDRIWWGGVNRPLEETQFDRLRSKVVAFLDAQPILYVVDAFAGADPAHRIAVRVVTSSPYHALFSKTLFIEPTVAELADFEPQSLVLHAPSVEAVPGADGTRSATFVVLHPSRSEVVIGGTFYA
ncbi:MAG: phosphoenolpyruvate carboxykinase (ATP), partial [Gaiellaceae bacterium]